MTLQKLLLEISLLRRLLLMIYLLFPLFSELFFILLSRLLPYEETSPEKIPSDETSLDDDSSEETSI